MLWHGCCSVEADLHLRQPTVNNICVYIAFACAWLMRAGNTLKADRSCELAKQTVCRGYEDMTLLKLRQAAERAAAIEQLKAEDAGQ